MTWPTYVSHKIVSAAPIVQINEVTVIGDVRVIFVDPHRNGAIQSFSPTEPGMRQRCVVGDYAIVYRDGYRSVCPKKEFEEGYNPT